MSKLVAFLFLTTILILSPSLTSAEGILPGNPVFLVADHNTEKSAMPLLKQKANLGIGDAERISPAFSRPLKVLVDPFGNATVFGSVIDPLYNIWLNRWTPCGGWGTSKIVHTTQEETYTGHLDAAVDPSGNILAVWKERDGKQYNIVAKKYSVGSGWGKAKIIGTNAGDAEDVTVNVDHAGNAFVIWRHESDGLGSIWANRHTAGSGWGTAEAIPQNRGKNYDPKLGMDSSGNAIVVWTELIDRYRYNIFANRYTIGSGWGTHEMIEADARGIKVAVDPLGNALAVWEKGRVFLFSIWANRYTVGSGWGTAEMIGPHIGVVFGSALAIDQAGNTVAVWSQTYESQSNSNLWSNRYTVGSGWGTAEMIETDNTARNEWPTFVVNPSGVGLAVWQQYDGSRWNLWGNGYTTGSGWGNAELIEQNDAGNATSHEVVIDPTGRAVVVWRQEDFVWSNHIAIINSPYARDDKASSVAGGAVSIAVLENDSDPDGDEISIDRVEQPANGTATLVGDLIAYQPEEGFHGLDSFDYTITDGINSATATVSATVYPSDGNPAAIVRGNNVEHTLTICRGKPLSLEVVLGAGSAFGTDADYWFVVATPYPAPLNWFYYNLSLRDWSQGQEVTYQGPGANLKTMTFAEIPKLPLGKYIFYFGIDTNRNGIVDLGELYYDKVIVTVTD